jgi:Type IV secretion-system coupling protein DNA-binding domain
MHHPLPPRLLNLALASVVLLLLICSPEIALAQASPFLTGASSLQTNILAWLTPVAIILVMVLGGMAMANRASQVSTTYGGDAQTLIENCGNTLILRCSGSENGGTSQFASRLIGEREVLRRQVSRGNDGAGMFAAIGSRRSRNVTDQRVTESAVMPSELEQLPDLCGYLKTASSRTWLKVAIRHR